MKINKTVIYKPIIFIFFMLFAIFQVYLLNSLTTYGSRINKIEDNITSLKKENEDLEQAIASASSVTTLNIKANALGLNTNLPVLSLQGPFPIAFSNSSAN